MFYIEDYQGEVLFIPFDKINHIVFDKEDSHYYLSVAGYNERIPVDEYVLKQYLNWYKMKSYGSCKVKIRDESGRRIGSANVDEINFYYNERKYGKTVHLIRCEGSDRFLYIDEDDARLVSRFASDVYDPSNIHTKDMEEFFDRNNMIRKDGTLDCEEKWKRMNEDAGSKKDQVLETVVTVLTNTLYPWDDMED